MPKELFISSSPHETKVAVLEDDQLVEVYYERDTDVGLVGGIYKGRVNRVLPGMQSAFVDIGLERDAFLYVSDFFFEDQEEYDKVFEEAEARANRFNQSPAAPVPLAAQAPEPAVSPAPPPAPVVAETPAPAPAVEPVAPPPASTEPAAAEAPASPPAAATSAPPARPRGERPGEFRRHERGGRQRHRRGRGGYGEQRPREPRFTPHREQEAAPPSPQSFEILPGESLAKYRHAAPGGPETAPPSEVAGAEHSNETPVELAAGAEPLSEATVGLEAAPVETSPAEATALPAEPAPPVAAPEPSAPEAAHAVTVQEPSFTPEAHAAAEPSRAEEPAAPAEPQATAPESEVPPSGSYEEENGHPVSESAGGPEVEAVPAEGAEAVAEAEAEAPSSAPGPTSETSPAASNEPREASYTLREPHQRPRFAPRRGRRGRRGVRPERPEPSRPGNNQRVQISEVLKEGQEILVQIAKGPLGTKGARITSHVALPGRYLVYMPTIDHIGVSRKIASEEERLRLRNIILENKRNLPGGFIVRTAGAGRPEEEFKADLKFLATLWSEIRTKAERLRAPALIHRDLDLVQRLLRDLLTPEFKCVRVDSEVDYERVLDFVNRCQPSLVGKVKLYTRETPLFEEFGVEPEIEKALKPKVWLKSGGYIVINQTEALVAVDVNTGKYVGKTNRLEDTILKTNIDAVNEIVRQIRLRDLGGIIVIDFIDMDERKNRFKVVQALEDALRHDRAPTKVISFHDFGLVAITRKRVKQSLERTLCEPCNYCSGAGWIRSVTTVCYEILAEARKMARQLEGDVVTLRVNPEVAKALKSREGALVSELESLTGKDIIIKSDPAVHQERFEIF